MLGPFVRPSVTTNLLMALDNYFHFSLLYSEVNFQNVNESGFVTSTAVDIRTNMGGMYSF